jgi:CheY-like chemotaxis protein
MFGLSGLDASTGRTGAISMVKGINPFGRLGQCVKLIHSTVRHEAPLALINMLDQVPILLAEDNRNDIFLMRQAFEQAAIPNPLIVVTNGRDAVDYLAGNGRYVQREKYPLPGMMLLDLKMPWMDGFDVLNWLRRQPQFRALPVVILTSSRLHSDIERSRVLGVYDYRVKPNEIAELVDLLVDIRKCWLDEQSHCCVNIPPALENENSSNSSEPGGLLEPPEI